MNKCQQCKFYDECDLYKIQNTQKGKFCDDFEEDGFNYEKFECTICNENYWLEIHFERDIKD